MATDRIAIRTDTAANWTSANPTLADGEQGYETDTGRRKVGDGTTAWTSLAYVDAELVSNGHLVGLTATQTLTNKTLDAPIITTGAYLGGTAAANLLDDYEKGTWTPELSFGSATTGITYSATPIGIYTKIGNTVHAYAQLFLTSKGTATGTARITLPFPAVAGQVVLIRINKVSYTGQVFVLTEEGLSSCLVLQVTEAGVQGTISDSSFQNDSQINVTATYTV